MKLPLLEELLKYHDENNLILSMPGNKCGVGFLNDEFGEKFAKRMGFLDITEVEPLDNLHCPEGIIKDAQELLAKTYKAKNGYFLVNGSSCGNLVAIFSAFNEGDEVLVERNCHKSVYNGLVLRKLKVRYIEPVIDDENGIFLPPNRENIYKALNKCINPKGIILTYPNYFGIAYDIEGIIKDLKEKGLKIIIDSAHGAHFGINKRLPKSISNLGDYVILSAHKTLPSLTQGAYLLTNEENHMIEFYLKCFMTTSPSYLIMASLDYARYYLDKYGKSDYEYLINKAEKWKQKINSLNKVHILCKKDLQKYTSKYIDRNRTEYKEEYNVDLSRYLLILPKGYSGHKLLDYFRSKNIQAEMSFSRGIVLILSPFNKEEDFNIIYRAIFNLEMKNIVTEIEGKYISTIPEKILEPYEVFEKDSKWCHIESSEGNIAKDAIIPYPPGIPLLCAGEIISKEAIKIIKEYILNNRSIIGVKENKIKIIIDN